MNLKCLGAIIALLAALLLTMHKLHAHGYQMADFDAWFESLKQPDQPNVSCCGKADHYWTDQTDECKPGDVVPYGGECFLVAIITDPRHIEGRPDTPVGTRVAVPKSKMRKVPSENPTEHGIIFMGPGDKQRVVYCYEPLALL